MTTNVCFLNNFIKHSFTYALLLLNYRLRTNYNKDNQLRAYGVHTDFDNYCTASLYQISFLKLFFHIND